MTRESTTSIPPAATPTARKRSVIRSPMSEKNIYISTKAPSRNREGMLRDIDTSLKMLKTDYVDILFTHNPVPLPGAGSEIYETLKEIQKSGKARFIGVSNHQIGIAEETIKCGLYDVLQFPFSYISDEREIMQSARAVQRNTMSVSSR